MVELRHHAIAPNERDHAFVRLPRALWPLYRAVRPARLAHQAVARLLHRLAPR
jgi:hypothetical protein